MIMDQALASLVTREREDYFGRLFRSLGASRPLLRWLHGLYFYTFTMRFAAALHKLLPRQCSPD